jgi:hypothetical protein
MAGRRASRLAMLICLFAGLGSCRDTGDVTAIMVVIDSDLAGVDPLSRVDVSVYAPDGRGAPRAARSFGLAAGDGAPPYARLPMSFTLVPDGLAPNQAFRLVVRGITALSARVEAQLLSRFERGRTLRLDVFLARSCVGHACTNDARGVAASTCVEGACQPIPRRDSLPTYAGGELGGYQPRLPVSGASDVVDGSFSTPSSGGAGEAGVGGAAEAGPASTADDAGVVAADADVARGSCAPGYVFDGRHCADVDECGGAEAIATCAATGYPCEQTSPPGYTCRGHRAD